MDTGPTAAGKILIDIEIGDLGRLQIKMILVDIAPKSRLMDIFRY